MQLKLSILPLPASSPVLFYSLSGPTSLYVLAQKPIFLFYFYFYLLFIFLGFLCCITVFTGTCYLRLMTFYLGFPSVRKFTFFFLFYLFYNVRLLFFFILGDSRCPAGGNLCLLYISHRAVDVILAVH